MTTIYNYSPVNKEYLGTGTARQDPLDQNNWLIPANATTIAPPEIPSGQTALFINGAWQLIADLRGQTVYNTTSGGTLIWEQLGPLSSDVTTIVPTVEYPKWVNGEWISDPIALAMNALGVSDMVAIRCLKAGVAFPSDWQEFVVLARQNVNGATNTLTKPAYPSGT